MLISIREQFISFIKVLNNCFTLNAVQQIETIISAHMHTSNKFDGFSP